MTVIDGFFALAVPLGSGFYTRADILVAYYSDEKTDHYDPGGGLYDTYVKNERTLYGARVMLGKELSELFTMRAGALLGSQSLYAEHGQCGTGAKELSKSSAALGGTAAIAAHTRKAEFAIHGDIYDAVRDGYCTSMVASGTFQSTSKANMSLLANGTFLF